MNDDDVREWYVQAMARAEGDADYPVGDIVSNWRATLHPVGATDAEYEPLPEDLGALFTVRWWPTRPSTVPSDESPDMMFGVTSGGFAIRTRSGVLLRDRDRARPQTRRVGGLIDDLTQEMAASRQWSTAGRGTEQVAAVRALAWLSLRLLGKSKYESAFIVRDWGGEPRGAEGQLHERAEARTFFQNAERTLRTLGLLPSI